MTDRTYTIKAPPQPSAEEEREWRDSTWLGSDIRHLPVPKEEGKALRHLSDLVGGDLDSYIKDFRASLYLYDHAWGLMATAEYQQKEYEKARDLRDSDAIRDKFLFIQWMTLAAHEAAFAIYHFDHCVRAINDHPHHHCPSIAGYVDSSKFKKAFSLLERYFPRSTAMRNTVGHRAERHATHTSRSLHLGKSQITALMTDRKLTLRHEGIDVSVEVSERSVKRLLEIRRLVHEAFAPAVEEVRRREATASKSK